MRDPQFQPTNDPAELARRTQELLVAERLLDPVFTATPSMWDDRFRNLDIQLQHAQRTADTDQLTKAVTRNADDLWTAEQDTTHPSLWHIYPPKNEPDATHPQADFIFTTGPDGRRRFDIGPIAPREMGIIRHILDDANEGR